MRDVVTTDARYTANSRTKLSATTRNDVYRLLQTNNPQNLRGVRTNGKGPDVFRAKWFGKGRSAASL